MMRGGMGGMNNMMKQMQKMQKLRKRKNAINKYLLLQSKFSVDEPNVSTRKPGIIQNAIIIYCGHCI